jgi:hypothetical protein
MENAERLDWVDNGSHPAAFSARDTGSKSMIGADPDLLSLGPTWSF